jgi:hypothetical protein
MPSTIPQAEQQALKAEAAEAIRAAVLPAYRKLLDFYKSEYFPKARTIYHQGLRAFDTISVRLFSPSPTTFCAGSRNYNFPAARSDRRRRDGFASECRETRHSEKRNGTGFARPARLPAAGRFAARGLESDGTH